MIYSPDLVVWKIKPRSYSEELDAPIKRDRYQSGEKLKRGTQEALLRAIFRDACSRDRAIIKNSEAGRTALFTVIR